MDVRCERCGTSYALDEARLGQGGARVRCARCGHVFLVPRSPERAAGAPSPSRPPGEPIRREWKVRDRDGSVSSFRELTTLQRWIVERKLDREDEIGLDGENWKRLGSIPDLEAFFAVVDSGARVAGLEAELARLRGSTAAPEPGDLASAMSALTSGESGETGAGGGAAASALAQPTPPPAVAASPSSTTPAPGPAPTATPTPEPSPEVSLAQRGAPRAPAAAGVQPTSRGTAGARTPSGKRATLEEPLFTRSVSGLGVSAADGWEPPKLSRGPSAWVLLVLVLLAAAGGAAWSYFRIWVPQQARAREEQARNAQLEREQKEHDDRLRAAELRAKEELIQSLATAGGRDAGVSPNTDAGQPRGSLEGAPAGPPTPGAAPTADQAIPVRAAAALPAPGTGPAAEPAEGQGAPAASAPTAPAAPRGLPQTFDEWMAEGHRRRTHERAAAALAAYDRALALRPSRSDAHAGRALALLDLGRRPEALAEFQRALELDPRDGIAVLGLAETYRSLGRTEDARRAYLRYLEGWPGGSEARAARAALETLKE